MDVYQKAKDIVAQLVEAGHIAYFAGGWVRDFIMGHPSEDIDIATNASPAKIMSLFPNTVPVGIAFGIVIVVVDGHQFEVATFRKDLHYIDGRHPTGIELSTPHEDALRRDFTINGMFYDPLKDEIHDHVHGKADIKLGLIRTIGDPHERFFEDRLRMLRAFRFAARFGFIIDQDTQDAIVENRDKLFPAVAYERVWQEFNKMVAYPRFDQAVVEMHRLGLLDVIFPEMIGMHIKELRPIVNRFADFPENAPTILYLMEMLPHLHINKKIEISQRIKASNKDIKLIEYLDQVELATKANEQQWDLWHWAHLMANHDFILCLEVIASRHPDREPFLHKFLTLFEQLEPHINRIKLKKPLVHAELLKRNGISPGKKMGLLIKEGEKIAINDNIHDADDIIKRLQSHSVWSQEC